MPGSDPVNPGRRRRPSRPALLASALLALQLGLGLALDGQRPRDGAIPPPPPPPVAMLVAEALGDRQLAFRMAALRLQEAGDGGGEITPLADYDYGRVLGWLEAIDRLDPRSDHVMAMAAYYFALVHDPKKIAMMVDFLARTSMKHPETRWRYLAQAAYLARHRLKDRKRAMAIARQLAGLDVAGLPVWVRQMPAFVLADLGEAEAAADMMGAILASRPDLPEDERRLMIEFIERQAGKVPTGDRLRHRLP
ncbi:MAG: hypothetical protein R3D03_04265 [Geminicoccaceae bacterium]